MIAGKAPLCQCWKRSPQVKGPLCIRTRQVTTPSKGAAICEYAKSALSLSERGFGGQQVLALQRQGILGGGNAGTGFEVLSLGNVDIFLSD